MDVIVSGEFGRLAVALVSGWTIYLGYRLFCDVPVRFRTRRASVVANMASGALLAMFGTGILIADVRGTLPLNRAASPVDHSGRQRVVAPESEGGMELGWPTARSFDRAV